MLIKKAENRSLKMLYQNLYLALSLTTQSYLYMELFTHSALQKSSILLSPSKNEEMEIN